VLLAEDESTTRSKFMKAVTDSGTDIRVADNKPGISNLLDILAATTGDKVQELEDAYRGKRYGDLKRDVADAVNDALRPVRQRYAELREDQEQVGTLLRRGAERAHAPAARTMTAVRDVVGLVST